MRSPGFSPPAGAQMNAGHPINTNLKVWLPLIERGGATYFDRAGRYNATPVANPTIANAPFGQGVMLNGSTQYIPITSAGFGTLISSGNFSVSVWVRPSAVARQIVLGDWDNTGANQSFVIELGGFLIADNLINTNIASGGGGVNLTSTMTYTTNQWYHIVVTRSATTRTLYVNGTNQNSDSEILYRSGVTLTAGRAGAFNGLYLNGGLANIRIWGRALTHTEVRQLYVQPYLGMQLNNDVGRDMVATVEDFIPRVIFMG